MQNTLSPDGAIFLSAIAAIAIAAVIYTIIKAMRNDGIAVVPDFFLFGVWGFTTSYQKFTANNAIDLRRIT